MIGFKLDFWDYATFLVLFMSVAIVLVFLIWLAGLPGRIAIARQHPDAEAVKIMGYAGFFTVVAWVQAFMWAFKPTDVVDIRRYPPEEQRAIESQIAKLKGENKEREQKADDNQADEGSANKEKP